ncbi:MAG TPA: AraC family transcriptional regulator [Caulobacteraceae bacterium]|jgi:AraC family transcriptional regulator
MRSAAGIELVVPHRTFAGASAHRAIYTGAMPLEEHAHDRPCLALHLLGRYREANEGGEAQIAGPAAVLHAAGSAHHESFGQGGAEVLILMFDPRWLASFGWTGSVERSRSRTGGPAAVLARELASAWMQPRGSEAELAQTTARFLDRANGEPGVAPQPAWLFNVREALAQPRPPSSPQLARICERHRAWMARAYRATVGEGIRETVRRKRVERAIALLRTTDWPLVEVALDAGFCDQSHMNRAVLALAGRTPAQVRTEGRYSGNGPPDNLAS